MTPTSTFRPLEQTQSRTSSIACAQPSRRRFLQSSGGLIGAAGLAGALTSNAAAEEPAHPAAGIPRDAVVLFQGDSITDAGRSRQEAGTPNRQPGLGSGYAWLAASQMLVDAPDHGLKIFNRGISGNKVFQLANRWQSDCLDLKPDVLSILIGVNDIWHMLNGNYDGTVERYERDYRALLNRTLKALPRVKIVVCEPFVLRCGAVNDKWFPEFDRYRAAARRIAGEFHAVFVPFQAMFDRAIELAEPSHWAGDGVHPSGAGAALMAHQWGRSIASH